MAHVVWCLASKHEHVVQTTVPQKTNKQNQKSIKNKTALKRLGWKLLYNLFVLLHALANG
jgi:hypothetical protein